MMSDSDHSLCYQKFKKIKDSVCLACVGRLFQSTADLYSKLLCKHSAFGLGTKRLISAFGFGTKRLISAFGFGTKRLISAFLRL